MRICYFNTWAKHLTESTSYLHAVPKLDLKPLVSNASDAALLTKARIDCDGYAENARCFAAMNHDQLHFWEYIFPAKY